MTMDELARWHEGQASQKDCTGRLYDHHTDAAATIRAAMAENERLREGLAKATTPSFYWDSEDSENGGDDLSVIMDNHDLGYVARLNCAASLPDRWAVGYVNDTGGFEAEAFLTEAEAAAFASSRAALKAPAHD